VESHAQMLHAIYQRDIIPALEQQIDCGEYRLESLLDHIETRWITEEEIELVDPGCRSFVNVNTPGDWQAILRQSRA
jgi:molybdopterin-guanine dinucleotide biosynthesis protein A